MRKKLNNLTGKCRGCKWKGVSKWNPVTCVVCIRSRVCNIYAHDKDNPLKTVDGYSC